MAAVTPTTSEEFAGFTSSRDEVPQPGTDAAGEAPAGEVVNNEQRIQILEAELTELRAQARIAELEAEANRLRSRAGTATIAGSSSASAGGASAPQDGNAGGGSAADERRVHLQLKSMKPEKLSPYKGLSEGEHIRWFREADLNILRSPDYFPDDRQKILYCMLALDGDPRIQWSQHTENGNELGGITYAYFKQFLMNLIADPVNRRLTAYERWEDAKQNSNQKVSAFKAYLEDLESHLPDFSENQRAFHF